MAKKRRRIRRLSEDDAENLGRSLADFISPEDVAEQIRSYDERKERDRNRQVYRVGQYVLLGETGSKAKAAKVLRYHPEDSTYSVLMLKRDRESPIDDYPRRLSIDQIAGSAYVYDDDLDDVNEHKFNAGDVVIWTPDHNKYGGLPLIGPSIPDGPTRVRVVKWDDQNQEYDIQLEPKDRAPTRRGRTLDDGMRSAAEHELSSGPAADAARRRRKK